MFHFGSIIDEYVFIAPARRVYEQGKQNDVPVITGLNRNENTGPVQHPDITASSFTEQSQKHHGDAAADFLRLYPASTDEEAKVSLMQSTWDYNRTGTWFWSEWSAKSKVSTYFGDHSLPGPDAEQFGAFHTSEVPYVLNTFYKSDRPFTDADRKIADTGAPPPSSLLSDCFQI